MQLPVGCALPCNRCLRLLPAYPAYCACYLTQAVCKHYKQRHGSYARELEALQAISSAYEPARAEELRGRHLWPQLLAVGDEQHVLVTQPFVKPLEGPAGGCCNRVLGSLCKLCTDLHAPACCRCAGNVFQSRRHFLLLVAATHQVAAAL